jgi:hypothetical protein
MESQDFVGPSPDAPRSTAVTSLSDGSRLSSALSDTLAIDSLSIHTNDNLFCFCDLVVVDLCFHCKNLLPLLQTAEQSSTSPAPQLQLHPSWPPARTTVDNVDVSLQNFMSDVPTTAGDRPCDGENAAPNNLVEEIASATPPLPQRRQLETEGSVAQEEKNDGVQSEIKANAAEASLEENPNSTPLEIEPAQESTTESGEGLGAGASTAAAESTSVITSAANVVGDDRTAVLDTNSLDMSNTAAESQFAMQQSTSALLPTFEPSLIALDGTTLPPKQELPEIQDLGILPAPLAQANGIQSINEPGLQDIRQAADLLPAAMDVIVPDLPEGGMDPMVVPDDIPVEPEQNERIAAFAKLLFEDGEFYMTTYSVVIGRDVEAARSEIRREYKTQRELEKRQREAPRTPKRRRTGSASQSRMSESGGIVAMDEAQIAAEKLQRRHSLQANSVSSASQYLSQPASFSQPDLTTHYQTLATKSLNPNATVYNNENSMSNFPDPTECPHIPIHPPKNLGGGRAGWKGISRTHAKIAYSFEENCFELHVLGGNGAFHDQVHYSKGESVALHHQSLIQIGGVSIKFLLPDMPISDDEDDGRSERSVSTSGSYSGKMSFSFENGQGESIVMSDDDESDSQEQMSLSHWNVNDYLSDDLVDSDSEEGEEEEMEAPKSKKQASRSKPTVKTTPKKQNRMYKGRRKRRGKYRRIAKSVEEEVEEEGEEEEGEEEEVEEEGPVQRSKNRGRESGKQPVKVPSKSNKALEKERAREDKARTKAEKQVAKEDKSKVKAQSPSREEDPDNDKPKQSTELHVTAITDRSDDMRTLVDDVVNGGRQLPPEEAERLGIPPDTLFTRKKGPGRPPKDGIMSKREKAIFARQKKEAEKALKMGLDPSKLPPIDTKIKSTPRPRKDSEIVTADGDGADGNREPGSAQLEGEKKVSKPMRPARSPSPEMKESDYTEEQLQRPAANYVVLIHEAISAHPNKAMTLQQIYSAIERKYPYYKFRTSTTGWQSSVRHNLGGHNAFVKKEKDGKGWVWTIDPEVSIDKDKGKKRPPTPPPQPHGNHYPYSYPRPGYPYGSSGTQTHNGPYSRPPATYPPPHGSTAQPPVPAVRIPSSLKGANTPASVSTTPARPDAQRQPAYASPYDPSRTASANSAPRPSPYAASPYASSPYGPPRAGPTQPSSTTGPPRQSNTPPSYPPRPSNTPPGMPPQGTSNHHNSYPLHRPGIPGRKPPPTRTPDTDRLLVVFKQHFLKNATSNPAEKDQHEANIDQAIDRVFHPEKWNKLPELQISRLMDSLMKMLDSDALRRPFLATASSQQPPTTATAAAEKVPGTNTPVVPSAVPSSKLKDATAKESEIPRSANLGAQDRSAVSASVSNSSAAPVADMAPKPIVAASKPMPATDVAKTEDSELLTRKSPTPPAVEPLTPPANRSNLPKINGSSNSVPPKNVPAPGQKRSFEELEEGGNEKKIDEEPNKKAKGEVEKISKGE